MEQEKEKLERFISAVEATTNQQVRAIENDAENECANILAEAQKNAEEAKQRKLSDTKKMLSGKYVRMISKAELDMKKQVLLCREALTKTLFDNIRKQIAEYRTSEQYAESMCAMIAKEGDMKGAQICIAPEDMGLSDKLLSAAGEGASVAADDSVKLGGYLVLRREQGTVTDRTYDCALKEQQSLFASRNLMTAQEGDSK